MCNYSKQQFKSVLVEVKNTVVYLMNMDDRTFTR